MKIVVQVITCALVLFVAWGSQSVLGQTHFSDCANRTGNNASLLVLTSSLGDFGGRPFEIGAEIAVFTPDGVCAGVATWEGENFSITAWGDDPFEPGKQGFAPGETMTFRVWSPEEAKEYAGRSVLATYSDTRHYYRTDGTYQQDAIYQIETLSVSRAAVQPPSQESGAGAGNVPDDSRAFQLGQNFPNPFYPSTTIAYDLNESAHVELDVVSLQGQSIQTLVAEHQTPGHYEFTFAGTDLPSGTYIYRLRAGGETRARTMILIK